MQPLGKSVRHLKKPRINVLLTYRKAFATLEWQSMSIPPLPPDEAQRLANLRSFAILDTLPQKAFDDITALASTICGTPIAVISLVDEDRQWFKSRLGLDTKETSRDVSFCGHAILQPSEVMVVPNALQDARFRDNELVQGDTQIRFYAGAPIISPEGYPLGTVCVIDQRERSLTPSQTASLRSLSSLVSNLLDHERLTRETEQRKISQAKTDNQILTAMVTESLDLKSFIDRDYVYRFVNPAYLRYWGREVDEIVGRSVSDLMGADLFENTIRPHFDRALAGHVVNYETELVFPVMGHRHVEVFYLPAHDGEGNIIGVVVRGHDIQRRKEHEIKLRQTVALLEHKTLEQDRFIHIISHDLREPINTINNFASLLTTDEDLVLPDPARRYLEYVRAGGERMKSLVDDLLDFLRMENHAVEKVKLDLTHLVSAVREDLHASLEKTGGKIEFGHLPKAFGDRSLLRIALQNLVSNGLKFTAKGVQPIVRLGARIEDGHIFITVQDNGIGMASDQTEKIFQMFQRLHSRKQYPGTGIGLSICRRIAELHGGTITVSSVPGEGSCFTLCLPMYPTESDEKDGHEYL
jgi:PAS domain S-box-containing protein